MPRFSSLKIYQQTVILDGNLTYKAVYVSCGLSTAFVCFM